MTLEDMKTTLEQGQIGLYVFHRKPQGLEDLNRAKVRDRDVWNIYFQHPRSVPPNIILESHNLEELVDKLEKEGFQQGSETESLYFLAIRQEGGQSCECVWVLSKALPYSSWLKQFEADATEIKGAA